MLPGAKQLNPQASDIAQPDQYFTVGMESFIIPVSCCLFVGDAEMIVKRESKKRTMLKECMLTWTR